MNGQQVRSLLTNLWQKTGFEKLTYYPTLTNVVHESWSGFSVRKHKDLNQRFRKKSKTCAITII
jgi:hypothetical protein